MTPPEARFWYNVRAHRFEEYKFRRHTPIGPFVADFTCRSAMLAIELDGDSHGATVEYDAQRTVYIEARGWRQLRFSNAEVMTNIDGVLLHLMACLTSPHPGPLP
jgi:very-short-patch-repair endonuclease